MYKYRFHYLLRQLPYDDYLIAMKWLPEKLCISENTWKRWIYLKAECAVELPLFRLEQIASFFQCTVEELHTYPRKKYDLAKKFQLKS